jgi:RNA polymerase sigma-70 factor (family 1)
VISSVSPKEREWVKGLLGGSEEIFRTVYDAYQRSIFSFAFYLTKSRGTAEDVTQEVFIRLWEKRESLAPDTHLLSWLKKVTQNRVLDIFRKASADKNLQEKLYTEMVTASESTPDRTLERELAKIYHHALQQLTPQQRLVFSLRNDRNLSYQQIAVHLSLSRNTVRNHLSIATHSIRKYVEQNADLGFLVIAMYLNRNGK